MRKLLSFILAVFVFQFTHAQNAQTQIGIGPDIGIPLGDFGDYSKVGIGGSVKLLVPVGEIGQFTFTSGYSVFKPKESPPGYDGSSYIIPILAGFRLNPSGIYIEPQVGYGIYGSKTTVSNTSYESTDGAFTYAIGTGYALNPGLDIGVRFQGASKDGSTTNQIGISARWNFALGGGQEK